MPSSSVKVCLYPRQPELPSAAVDVRDDARASQWLHHQWLKQPESNRARENQRLTALVKESWLESGGIYGSLRIHVELREAGETCSENPVARLMNLVGD